MPRLAGRQVERDGLAGDEVVGGEGRELRADIAASIGLRARGQPRLVRRGPRRLRAGARARVAAPRRARRARRLTGAESDELVERYQQVATHLSVVRTSAPDASAGRPPVLAAGPGPQPGRVGTRVDHLARRRRVLHRAVPGGALPAALVVARRASPPTWWSPRVMMLWLLEHPNVEQSLMSPAEIDQLVNEDFEGYYSEYAAEPLRRPGLDQQRLGRRAVPGARRPRASRWSTCCSRTSPEPRDHRLDHDPARPRRALLGAAPPARAARADGRLRGRRRGAAAVLVVGRAAAT